MRRPVRAFLWTPGQARQVASGLRNGRTIGKSPAINQTAGGFVENSYTVDGKPLRMTTLGDGSGIIAGGCKCDSGGAYRAVADGVSLAVDANGKFTVPYYRTLTITDCCGQRLTLTGGLLYFAQGATQTKIYDGNWSLKTTVANAQTGRFPKWDVNAFVSTDSNRRIRRLTDAGAFFYYGSTAIQEGAEVVLFGSTYYAAWFNGSGSPGYVASSSDRVNWTAATSPFSGASPALLALVAASSRMVIFGQNTANDPRAYYGTNGSSWTTVTMPDYASGGLLVCAVALGNLVVCAGTRDAGNSTTRLHYSTDGGLTWNNAGAPHNTAGSGSGKLLTNGSSIMYWRDGSDNQLWISTTGATWTSMGIVQKLCGVLDGKFIAQTTDTKLRYWDGAAWQLLGFDPGEYVFVAGTF